MTSIRMIDIAVNLTDSMFKGVYNGKHYHSPDIQAVLTRAWAAGVDRIIITGGSLEDSRNALAMAETDGRLFCTVGVHPTRCNEFEDSGCPEKHMESLYTLAKEGIKRGKVVAIGECGLDYDRLHFCPAEVQKRYFEKQFELAKVMHMPMFLHMRAAIDDFCEIFRRNSTWLKAAVAHSFTGSSADRDRLLSFSNLFIGVNGCSLKTQENLDVVRGVPVDRLMIETDSPYCEIKSTHAGHVFVRSRFSSKRKDRHDHESTVKGRNEPCLVRQVLEAVAGCRKIDNIVPLSERLYHNALRSFFPLELELQTDGEGSASII